MAFKHYPGVSEYEWRKLTRWRRTRRMSYRTRQVRGVKARRRGRDVKR